MSETTYRFRGTTPPDQSSRMSILEPAVDGTVATLRLYDPIDSWGGWWGVSAKEFSQALAALPSDTTEIHLHLNSPGGEVHEAIAILNQLRGHPARVVAIVDGLAASAASFIAAGAEEVVMGRNSELMIHDAWGGVMGNAEYIGKYADGLDRISNNIASIYSAKAGGSTADWRDRMRAETWYSADEAVEVGLADRVDGAVVVEEELAAAASFDLTQFTYPGRRAAPSPHARRADHAAAAAHMPPAEPVESINTHRKESAMADLIQGLRERLGLPADAQVDDEGILAAVDSALAARPESFTPPEGTVLLDASQMADLQAAAEEGRQARQQQVRAERESLVDAAVSDGRIPPARKDHWLNLLEKDDEGGRQALASLAPGTIPLAPVGYTGGVDEASDEDRLYVKAWGTTEKKEA